MVGIKEARVKKGKESRRKGYRLATYPAAVRMARLVDEMPRHGIGSRLKSLAETLGVSEQTIKRYVKALNEEFLTEEGEPQFVIKKEGNEEWLVRRHKYSGAPETNIYYLVSIYLALEMFKLLSESVVAPTLEQVLEKVEQQLPESHRALLQHLPRKFFAAPSPHKDYSAFSDQLNDAIKAIVYQIEAEIVYKKPGEQPKTIEIKPLTLLYHRGTFYLVALSWDYDRPVYYNVERIQSLQLLTDRPRFSYPPDYHPRQMIQGAFGVFSNQERIKTFRLCFPPEMAEYILSWNVHPSQKFSRENDGSVILTLRVTDSEEVKGWIRSFGDQVKVLAPPEK